MFDIAWSEMALIAAVALIVIGPKDLPRVLRTLGFWVRKARNLAGEFQRNIDDMVREAELDDVKQQVERIGRMDVKREVELAVDPTGEIEKGLRIEEAGQVERPSLAEPTQVAPAPDAVSGQADKQP